MKNIIKVLTITFLGSVFAQPVMAQKKKDKDLFEVQVDGLGCPFCAYGLEKKIKEFKGIKNIKIDMESGDFSFTSPSDKELSLEEVENKVDKAGYTAISSKVTRADGSVQIGESVAVSDKVDRNRVVKTTIFVEGTCKMCRARISKAARRIEGIVEADWDEKSKIMSFSYDKSLCSKDDVEKAVVAMGHDTRNISADDEVYENLPACCLYERIKREK
tara:strand:+ start:1104 stop:1754 length:651 start_codon:yes stop_codon:yes gene_type:complete